MLRPADDAVNHSSRTNEEDMGKKSVVLKFLVLGCNFCRFQFDNIRVVYSRTVEVEQLVSSR